MAWIYFQVEADSQKDYTDGSDPLLTVRSTEELSVCFSPEWREANYPEPQSGMTCLHCGAAYSPEWTSSLADSPVRISLLQDMEAAWTASEADLCLSTSASFASASPDSSSWRTYQHSLFGGLTEYSWDSMRWGMMRDGQLYQPLKWAPRTSESGSGSLPTPTTVDGGSYFNKSLSDGAANRPTLGAMARYNLWPTPRASEHKGGQQAQQAQQARDRGSSPNLSESIAEAEGGGKLNPARVEWLMGWPIGSTVCESWVMESSLYAPKRRSSGSLQEKEHV